MIGYERTIISQYAKSTSVTLWQLIENANTYIDPIPSISDFYIKVWNVDTAETWGLDIWGRIVGVQRVLQVTVGDYFGFASSIEAKTFGEAPFYGGQPATSNFALTNDAFRVLIYAKALANISDGSIPSINRVLLNLFPGRGNCYVDDGLDGTMTYVFEFPLTPVELAIVSQSGVLPRPTGVRASVSVI